MKIGILTQPLHTNYGGLLQAYALQVVLRRMGHDAWTEDRKPNPLTVLDKMKRLGFIRSLFGKQKIWIPNKEEELIIAQHTNRFIRENLQITESISSTSKKQLEKYNFNAYVVGSDQVWRPKYSYGIGNYFLDFVKKRNIKKIAYAVSFGVDDWEYTDKQTKKCRNLAQKFDAISVREDSAIGLCKNKLGVEAIHVLDPTMLLDKQDYIKLVEKDNILENRDSLMTYILDKSHVKSDIVNKVEQVLKLKTHSVMPKDKFENVGSEKINDCVFPAVTEWIRGFMDAEFVVTDSFHGTVFSIIFNKPFIVIVNEERGITRFRSLLKKFDLEERIIDTNNVSIGIVQKLISTTIDYNGVNLKLKEFKGFSRSYLNNQLDL